MGIWLCRFVGRLLGSVCLRYSKMAVAKNFLQFLVAFLPSVLLSTTSSSRLFPTIYRRPVFADPPTASSWVAKDIYSKRRDLEAKRRGGTWKDLFADESSVALRFPDRGWLAAPVGAFLSPPAVAPSGGSAYFVPGLDDDALRSGATSKEGLLSKHTVAAVSGYEKFPPYDFISSTNLSVDRRKVGNTRLQQEAPAVIPSQETSLKQSKDEFFLPVPFLSINPNKEGTLELSPSDPSSSAAGTARQFNLPNAGKSRLLEPSPSVAVSGTFVMPRVVVETGDLGEDEASMLEAVLLKADSMGLIPRPTSDSSNAETPSGIRHSDGGFRRLKFTKVPRVLPSDFNVSVS